MNRAEELLKRVNKILEEEGIEVENLSEEELMTKFILPGLENSKSTLEGLYLDRSRQRPGLVGKLKSFILTKLENVSLGVVERQSVKQQKFNELVYKAIVNINKRLDEKD